MITHQTAAISESDIHTFVAFASDLYDDAPELRAGWPVSIKTSIGNGLPFFRVSKKVNRDNDIEYVRYRQQYGCVDLIIYNT